MVQRPWTPVTVLVATTDKCEIRGSTSTRRLDLFLLQLQLPERESDSSSPSPFSSLSNPLSLSLLCQHYTGIDIPQLSPFLSLLISLAPPPPPLNLSLGGSSLLPLPFPRGSVSFLPSFPNTTMAFETGTAYPESDADDEYERSVHDRSPVAATDSEASPTDSEGPSSNEHTPTTYGGGRSSGDRIPETSITEWSADECADFVSGLGLRQYGDLFLGMCGF